MSPYILSSISIIVGLAVLIGGGELLLRGATFLAAATRISPLVIGLTVVAFGTSAPELAVCVRSVWAGQSDLAIGNVVGSNIANVLLVLGLSAMIVPLVVSSKLVRIDVPLMVFAAFLLIILGWDGTIGRLDGLLLFTCLLVYIVWSIVQSRKASKKVLDEFSTQVPHAEQLSPRQLLWNVVLVIVGLALLAYGARWLVNGSASIARLWQVPELIIGLTIVAIGTSTPEVITSVMASLRGQRDIAVGSVVGSNLFNSFGVLGVSGIVAPSGVEVSADALAFDIPVMIAVSVACLPIFFTGSRIARWEGGLFFAYYIGYLTYLVIDAADASFGRTYSIIMIGLVIPLTAITLSIAFIRAWRQLASDNASES